MSEYPVMPVKRVKVWPEVISVIFPFVRPLLLNGSYFSKPAISISSSPIRILSPIFHELSLSQAASA